MASAIETFETMLKEVVTSKRLSTSKMSSLSEHALKYMKMDTQLVSTLFLTHKALPSSNKVNSLYVFDALARAAKHQVTKRKLTLPTEPDKGNPVTFLLKMEGVLDGLFKDLLAVTDVPEMKEKMKKVLDIWSKAGTFSTDVLTRLSDLAKESEQDQVANRAQTSVTDPRRPTKSPVNGTVDSSTPPISPPTGTPASLPPALLALLSAAAQGVPPVASGSASASATPGETSGNYAAQLALLQQLAAAGGLVNSVAVPAAVQPAVPSSDPSPVHRGVHNFTNRDDDWQRPPPPARYSQDYPLDSRMSGRDEHSRRGQHGYRGRPADPRRGRGGASWHTGRGDSRTSYRDRSRSRSPPPHRRDDMRGVRGRGARPYSPLRNGMSPTTSHFPSSSSPRHPSGGGQEAGAGAVDEFGRDIPETRATASSSAAVHASTPAPAARPTRFSRPHPPPRIPTGQPIPTFDSYESASSNIPTASSPQLSVAVPSKGSHIPNVPLLSEFDFSAFDFTSPSSWEALGASFEATNGYAPSQEETMGIVMMAMSSMAGPVDVAGPSPVPTSEGNTISYMGQPGWSGSLGDEGNGHGAGEAVVGYLGASGQGEEGQEQAQAGSYHDPNWNVPSGATNDAAGSDPGPASPTIEAEGRSSRGGMKRIGDRWVWQQDN